MTETVTINPQRSIGGLDVDCTVDETGFDTYTATRHPVEQGASITDHRYREPARLRMRIGYSNSSAQAAGSEGYVIEKYNDLLALQASDDLLTVVTGKRTYKNMVISSLSQKTDQETETTLLCDVSMEELIIVTTQVTTVPAAEKQATPEKTGAVQQRGTVQPVPASLSPNDSVLV